VNTPESIITWAHEAAPDLTWYAAVDDPSQAAPDELAFLTRFAEKAQSRLIELLAHAVKRIDEGYSGPADILDDPLMAEARALAQAAQQSDPPAPGNTSR